MRFQTQTLFWLGAAQQLPSGKRDPPMDPLFFLYKKAYSSPKRSKFPSCAALTRGLRFVAEGIGVYVLICPSQQKVKIVDFSTHLMSWRPLAASRPALHAKFARVHMQAVLSKLRDK